MTDSENAQSTEGTSLYVGVDVGGTYIKLGLVDGRGNVIARAKLPTPNRQRPDGAVADIARSLQRLLEELGRTMTDVMAIGIGTPGPLDVARGMLLTPSNLPGWHNYPMRQRLQDACHGRPVSFMNDANAAAYGEFWVGEGHAARSVVLLTLGTGVGGGIILDDQMWTGHHDHGAELGHLCLDHSPSARRCSCGGRGHLEAYASATAVVQRTEEALSTGAKSSLQQFLADNEPLTALRISEHAVAGDDLALKIIQETAHYLGWAVADLAHTIDPELFLIGGAMNFGGAGSPLGQRFLSTIRETAAGLTFPIIAQNLRVEFASLRGDAGWIGAAGWARRSAGRL